MDTAIATNDRAEPTGPLERAHRSGGGEPVGGLSRRFSAQRKLEAVRRLMRGEPEVAQDPSTRQSTPTSKILAACVLGALNWARLTGGRGQITATMWAIMDTRATSRMLIPSTWQARRTRPYKSTEYIPRLSIRSNRTERLKDPVQF